MLELERWESPRVHHFSTRHRLHLSVCKGLGGNSDQGMA